MLPSPSPLLQTAPEPSLTLGAKNEGVGAEKAVKRKGVKVALSPGPLLAKSPAASSGPSPSSRSGGPGPGALRGGGL